MERERGISLALSYTTAMLMRARSALGDLYNPDQARATTAVYMVAVFGRATTQVLQTIRTYDREHFNAWWVGRSAFMDVDPLFSFFNRIRNQFLKEGGVWHENEFALVALREPGDATRFRWYFAGAPTEHDGRPIIEPEPGPTGTVAGLKDGRWVIILENHPSVGTLSHLYCQWLQNLLAEARVEFLGGEPTQGA
jgi:hypothetical protein